MCSGILYKLLNGVIRGESQPPRCVRQSALPKDLSFFCYQRKLHTENGSCEPCFSLLLAPIFSGHNELLSRESCITLLFAILTGLELWGLYEEPYPQTYSIACFCLLLPDNCLF